MSKLFNSIPTYAPETPTGSSGSTTAIEQGEMSKEDVITFLGEDEDDAVDDTDKLELDKGKKSKPVDDDDEESEEVDDLKELEDELEGPTDDQLELVTPVRRKEILNKYPTLFKDFPYLEKAYYREQQYTELLPTIEDAKEAVGKAKVLDLFEQDILSGNTQKLLQSVKQHDQASFNKIVDEYLPNLARVDEKAYYHVVGNMIKHTIVNMVQESKNSNNEALLSAAQILNQFVFGNSKFEPPQQLSRPKQTDDRETQIQQREQALVTERFEGAKGDLNTRVSNTLQNTIEANIDPNGSMSDYVRRNATRDAINSLTDLIGKDGRFVALNDKLWEKAFSENFSKASIDRIKSAYLSKAKTLLPAVIKQARNEALREGKRKVDNEEEASSKKGPLTVGRPRSSDGKSGKITKASDIPKNMKTLDFLNSD